MVKNLIIAVLMTIVTTVIFGLAYPLVVTGLAQVLFRDKANGQLIERNGQVVGSRIIGNRSRHRATSARDLRRRARSATMQAASSDRTTDRPTRS
jgi:K+-transporting ATPase c subunit